MDIKQGLKKTIPYAIIFFAIGWLWSMYQTSLREDFNDIPQNEIERIGDGYTGEFHRLGCPHAKNIKSKTWNFKDRDEAIKNGYRPCKRCKP